MSRFLSKRFSGLVPYTPGEQPDKIHIKLNTNESPFPPSQKAQKFSSEAAKRLQLYPDPECKLLTKKLADMLGVEKEELLLTNGSDEILNFAFMAYCDENHPATFCDITYGFYSVFAQLHNIPYEIIKLKEDFSVDVKSFIGINKTIFIANPNAPTGLILPPSDIEKILISNPDNVVVIDEAYIDFGNESVVPLIHKYKNLLVTQTFSKSRSMAGARLGFGVGSKELIEDLNKIKYSTNPYNINSMTMAAGLGVLEDEEYTRKNCDTIVENRNYTTKALSELGFEVLNSHANFIFAKHPQVSGETIYEKLREKAILVRHFTSERISMYNRITIGTLDEMNALIDALKLILKEIKK